MLNSHLQAILKALESGNPEYTHRFEFLSPRVWEFRGKENRPYLRKCLRKLESEGYVENINLGFNIHQWKITEKGLKYLPTIN